MAWQTVFKYGKSFCTGFVVGLPIYITVTDFGFCIARVDGVSMQPSLNPVANESDIVFLNRWAVRNFQKVKRGDIVSLISPSEPDVKLIKRVIGLEGDIIKTLGYKKSYVLIPKGHCWIEGDHRGRSLDSNTFGPVSIGLINGLATHVLWPPKRWTKLENTLKDDRIPVRKLPSYSKRELITKDRDISNENMLQCPVMMKKQNAMLEKDVEEQVNIDNGTINKDINKRTEDIDSMTIEDDDCIGSEE